MKPLHFTIVLLASMVWTGISPCHAEPSAVDLPPVIVFDSFGPRNSYYNAVVWGVTGASTSYGYRGQAEWFVPESSGKLSTIELATYRKSGSGRSNFHIAQDSGFGVPGTIFESFVNILNTSSGLLTLQSDTHPLLQAGVKYWVCDEPADSTTVNGWYQNNQNYMPGFAYERSQWGWSSVDPEYSPPSGVMRISVTPVPEPGALALALLGMCLLQLKRRRAALG